MANAFNEDFMRLIARAGLDWAASGGSNIRAALIDHADDTPAPTTDLFMSDIASAAIEERTGNLTLINSAHDGVLCLNDFVFTSAAGDPCESFVFYKFVTVDADSPYFIVIYTATGLPVTLNGGDVNVAIHASGLCKI
jgi:hypothetical protein